MLESDTFPHLILRIDFGGGRRLGLGTLKLLEGLAQSQSLSETATTMQISQRRVGELVERLNGLFHEPVIVIDASSPKAVRQVLSQFGQMLLTHLRAIEAETNAAAATHMTIIAASLRE